MKVQTNAGEVELTPEMVRPGMVFTNGVEQFVAGEPAQSGVWKSAEQGKESDRAALMLWHLLGCDPDIAARADCERYGIAPGIDAAEHGFARLRDGGAVDLRRECPEGAVYEWDGLRRLRLARAEGRSPRVYPLGEHDRFIGLDTRHASPEDMRRLCCGEVGWVDGEAHQCSIAIGDHNKHEDLATGVKWGAKAETAPAGNDPLPAPGCGRAALEDAARAVVGFLAWCCRVWDERPNTPKGFNPPGTYHCLGCDEKVRHGTPHDCAAEMEQRQRREREAPLVALVSACPAGLDPIGWRAAVLAIKESMGAIFDDATMKAIRWRQLDEQPPHKLGSVEWQIREGEEGIALRAYRRAIAPQGPRPSPFRRKAPGLPVDDGRDDA